MRFGVFLGTGIYFQYSTSSVFMRAAGHRATFFGEGDHIGIILEPPAERMGWDDGIF